MDSEERDFEIILKDEKVKTVNQSLSNLKKGMEETQVRDFCSYRDPLLTAVYAILNPLRKLSWKGASVTT